MLENNLVFSLVSSSLICIIIYCINYKKNNITEDKKNDIILLFGISFATVFILRIVSQNNNSVISTGTTINNYKPPF